MGAVGRRTRRRTRRVNFRNALLSPLVSGWSRVQGRRSRTLCIPLARGPLGVCRVGARGLRCSGIEAGGGACRHDGSAQQDGDGAVRAYETWYRVRASRPATGRRWWCVHGGPGSTHDYLLNLRRAEPTGRPVVHYDQLGNGGSTHLRGQGADFWTVDLFLAELDNLLRRLGIADGYVLFGQSWGGVLVGGHAAAPAGRAARPGDRQLPRVVPVVAAGAGRAAGRAAPGGGRDAAPARGRGTTGAPRTTAAMRSSTSGTCAGASRWPRSYLASFMEINGDPTVYHAMNGPSEFHVIGTLRDYSLVDRLPQIDAPTLVISGEHDEVTPARSAPTGS